MIPLEYLRAFEQAVRTGSFTAAADRLGISRPAVSKSIAQLEMQLDTRLFNRTTRRLHLTAEGRTYFEKVSAGLAQLDEASELLKESRMGPTGLIRVSSITVFGKYYILPLLPTFFSKYPKVDLEMSFNDGMPDLIGQGLDVGIVRGSKKDSSLISRRLYELHDLFLVASPSYLMAHGVPMTLADLASHQFIRVRLSTGEVPAMEFEAVDEFGGKADQSHRVLLNPQGRLVVTEHFDAVIDASLAGLGIAISHFGMVASHLAAGELKVVLPDYRIRSLSSETQEIFIRYPHREYLPLKIRVFVDFLTEHFRGTEAAHRDLAQYAVLG
ncbi:Putative transcriptional regulator, LysR family [Aromatoleum petrolei]|nr:Putative transcriptional regulator, LysR family [Aromatoleum petrolei]